jgi:hypothetical protein
MAISASVKNVAFWLVGFFGVPKVWNFDLRRYCYPFQPVGDILGGHKMVDSVGVQIMAIFTMAFWPYLWGCGKCGFLAYWWKWLYWGCQNAT